MQPNTYARPDDETHRQINDETLRQQLKRNPAMLRRLLSLAQGDGAKHLVRRLAQIAGLIEE